MSIEQALESITKMELMCHYCRLIISKNDLKVKYDELVVSNHDLSDKYDKLVEQSNLERERAKSQIEHLQFIINSIYNRTLELNEKMQNGIITNQQLIEEITWLINHISCMYKFNEDAIKH